MITRSLYLWTKTRKQHTAYPVSCRKIEVVGRHVAKECQDKAAARPACVDKLSADGKCELLTASKGQQQYLSGGFCCHTPQLDRSGDRGHRLVVQGAIPIRRDSEDKKSRPHERTLKGRPQLSFSMTRMTCLEGRSSTPPLFVFVQNVCCTYGACLHAQYETSHSNLILKPKKKKNGNKRRLVTEI